MIYTTMTTNLKSSRSTVSCSPVQLSRGNAAPALHSPPQRTAKGDEGGLEAARLRPPPLNLSLPYPQTELPLHLLLSLFCRWDTPNTSTINPPLSPSPLPDTRKTEGSLSKGLPRRSGSVDGSEATRLRPTPLSTPTPNTQAWTPLNSLLYLYCRWDIATTSTMYPLLTNIILFSSLPNLFLARNFSLNKHR